MQSYLENVEAALADLRQGKMIILIDHPDRENEGDLVCSAEHITPEGMNFIIRHTSGIVCLSLAEAQLKKLALPLMIPARENSSARGTPFTISIDAKHAITTGVSAVDRVKTIQATIHEQAQPEDLVKPGHIFPLQARAGGVLERAGHTEGAVDIVRLAGLKPAGVLCELMNPDGSMMQGTQLAKFAAEHTLKILSIDDIIAYRRYHENLIEEEVIADLPLESYGAFKISVIKEKIAGHEHVVLTKNVAEQENVLVRIHSACLTGDLFGSLRCDCHHQLRYSLQRISEEGGILIYLSQEGRGIGLLNKIKAYALQEQGFDTIEANQQLGLPVDSRQYYIAANVLRNRGIGTIRLLTNNPHKISALKKCGVTHITMEAMPIFANDFNKHYLQAKKDKLNHFINNHSIK
jgi:3,4-dihydroxy 2-butanone 4-phosphate synthase/GTP cyclohydrolase II